MKTLIWSDIHNRLKPLRRLMKRIDRVDRVVFLGDWFDSWGDYKRDEDGRLSFEVSDTAIKSARSTAIEYKKALNHPKCICLMGNHDAPYILGNNKVTSCAGHTPEKHFAISDVLGSEDREKVKVFTIVEGWLLSHAGFHPSKCHPVRGVSEGFLKGFAEMGLVVGKCGGKHPLFDIGWARQGKPLGPPFGGPLWLDWNEGFKPIKGVSQIVGHTIVDYPQTQIGDNSFNHNLDTLNKHFGIIEDGKFEFYPTKEMDNVI